MKTQQTPGVRHDYKTDQYVPTLDGVDTSPTSFDETRALQIAQEQSAQAETGTHSPLEKLYKSMWETEKAHAERLAAVIRYTINGGTDTRVLTEALAQWEQQQ